ncbi:MAG: phospho-N-acetylmuramoyl-pentapeptide-transferase [Bdellovibrionales bacterium]|jgi:phospho-N-acetylmuramoyl-pentapeptide-transferase|nr:phospho-N-acetylmuramoyl-pentapeptide-transferase [Bdellovibrionales bacterium]
MLFHFLYPLSESISGLNIFRYITLRSGISFLIATIVSIFLGKSFIIFMKKRQFGQTIRELGPESHFKKTGTPTMGGVVIMTAITVALAISGNFNSYGVCLIFFVAFSYFILGYIDDYIKVIKRDSRGVSAKTKLIWQIVTAVSIGLIIKKFNIVDSNLYIPFFKGPLLDLGIFYIPFVALVIVGSSNAVNLTDGLDGLAIGPIMTSAMTLGVIAYLTGHVELSKYLYLPYINLAGEITVFCAAIVGAGVGFLWYNSYPAQVFMGDVGSLPIGGILGIIAVLTKQEVLFILIGGIFVIEAVSVIIQVTSYKLRKKRVFKMAPIHHHFELKGWPEPKVIVRFWIISLLLAILSVATLKIR